MDASTTRRGKRHSAVMTDGPDRAPARAMLRAIGFTAEDLAKPIIGVGHAWIETMPCNYNHRALAEHVKAGIREAGALPMEFNTIAVSDGVSMGTEGMRASLVSREVIADSIELVARGHSFDGLVLIVGCDKTIPAAAMALCRLDIPGLVMYSGTIAAGRLHGRDITLQEVFEAVGAHAAGTIDDAELAAVEASACPGAGACGGQFTANTMSTAMEFLGLSPAGRQRHPRHARRQGRRRHARRAASPRGWSTTTSARAPSPRATPSRTPSPASPPAAGRPTPCSTCSPSPPRRACRSTSPTSTASAAATPVLVDIKPGGRFVAADVHAAGGLAVLAQRLQELGLLHDGCATVDGRTIGEIAAAARETAGQEVIRAVGGAAQGRAAASPSSTARSPPTGAWSSSPATSAPGTAARPASSTARRRASRRSRRARIRAGDVVVIRYEGPVGGPGMREMLSVTGAIVGAGPRRTRWC